MDVIFRLYPYPAQTEVATELFPFALKDVHKRVKAAFDPNMVMSPQLSLLNEKDIQILKKKKSVRIRNLKTSVHRDWDKI